MEVVLRARNFNTSFYKRLKGGLYEGGSGDRLFNG